MFFFFKQKTAYEMRISDWSSDVCSSDLLADWGADVIKIEEPPKSKAGEGLGGPRDGFDFQNLHRNKRSITLNQTSDPGKKNSFYLVKTVDVAVESDRPDEKSRLGIDDVASRTGHSRHVNGQHTGLHQAGTSAHQRTPRQQRELQN